MNWKLALTTAVLAGLAGCAPQPEEPPAVDRTSAAGSEASEPLASGQEVQPNGKIIKIAMLTRDPDDPDTLHVFDPRLIKASVGDTIVFVPTDPDHQSSSIAGMLPEGAQGWEGEINEEVSYVVPRPGIYGYQCVPHYGAGMVGLIVVEGDGMTDNLEAAQEVAHPGLAGRAFNEIFAEARARGLLRASR